ncbi:hypothetical protein D3C81_1752270 [compost metagenome]
MTLSLSGLSSIAFDFLTRVGAGLVTIGGSRSGSFFSSAASLASFLSLASIAAKICSRSCRPTSSISCELVETEGFRIKSNAPSSNAIIVSCIPCSLMPESMITGRGCSFMMTLRASSPFISGISTSIVTMSGESFLIASIASFPFLAVPTT